MPRRTDEPRDRKAWVYLTEAEHEQLSRLAASLDMTLSALVRASALGTLKQSYNQEETWPLGTA